MEQLKEALLSGNIIVWVVTIVVLVLVLKFIKSAGKLMIIVICLVVIGLALQRYAPGVIAPVSDFVRGGWLGDQRP